MNMQLIDLLASAWNGGRSLSAEQARALAPRSHADAYRIQQGVGTALGWFDDAGPRFWKLGGSPGSTTAAAIPETAVKTLHAGTPARLCSEDACHFTALEVELAVRLGRPLLPGATLEEACDAVSEVYLAIEVCDLRAPDWQQLPATYRLADQQMNRGFLLVGKPLLGWRGELEKIAPAIALNEQTLSNKPLSHPQGHPLAALPWLANLSGALNHAPLAAGTLIATGAWAGMHTLTSGDLFYTRLDGFEPFRTALDVEMKTAETIRFGATYNQSAQNLK